MFAERLLHDAGLHHSLFSATQTEERARGLSTCVHRGLCALGGHDLFLHYEPGRLSLQCVDCGWESSGWTIERPRFSCEPRHRPVRRAAHR